MALLEGAAKTAVDEAAAKLRPILQEAINELDNSLRDLFGGMKITITIEVPPKQ